ncbi:MAG: RecQ family ATP-dependent DNA helicase [Actinomycetota bacterium]
MPSAGDRALSLLRELAGPDAEFRDGQLEAISTLVERRSRVLVVQRTGWGKSAVYFIATKLLREQGHGPTLLVSPLLALMRNQIQMAERLGVRADTVNSSNTADWDVVRERFEHDEIDVLLISPERFANRRFREEYMPTLAGGTGLMVVDEIHCISDWGHDFRPDYRRIRRILDLLPAGVPVLGTTATANDRVVNDVKEQLGGDLTMVRGPLARTGLRLQVLRLPSPAQRLAWLVTVLPSLGGTGIVYCLTIRDTVKVASWLGRNGISAVAYHSDLEVEQRAAIEADLIENRVKVVVATSALGMGFDKPDLAFVIHFQSPGSPIAYYQQVGRAGRALATSLGILLTGNEDREIQDYFIRTAFPPQHQAERIVSFLEHEARPVTRPALEAAVNVSRSKLQQMLTVLEVEGAVEKADRGYLRTLRRWEYPGERVDGVTAARRREQQIMEEYIGTTGCLMEFLGNELDDHDARPCGICTNCAGPGISVEIDDALVRAATGFLRRQPIVVEPRLQWPSGQDLRSGWIAAEARLEPGRALSHLGDGGWGSDVRDGKYRAGSFGPELVEAAARLIREWSPTPEPTWVTFVPSLTRDRLVADFARDLARTLDFPLHQVVLKEAGNQPQKEMQNSAQQFRNVINAFRIDEGGVMSGPVLLIDDLFDSRWTLTVVGVALREAGSGPVFPFVLAAAVSQ